MSSKTKSSEISILPFEKALRSLTEVFKKPKNAITRDAGIQRFEYTFELSWKILKRYFKVNNNLDIFNIKDIFREGGNQGLIENVEKWFEYLEARNLTSHTYDETYDENTAEKVFEKAREFERAALFLLSQLKKLIK